MADITLFCPSCNGKVRTPEEHLGQLSQCPLCGFIFRLPVRNRATATMPGAVPPAGVEPAPSPASLPSPGLPVSIPAAAPPPALPGVSGARNLRPPAVILLIWASISLLFSIRSVAQLMAMGSEGFAREMEKTMEALPPAFARMMQAQMQMNPEQMLQISIGMHGMAVLFSVVVLAGSLMMLRLQMYWLAMVGSLLACINYPYCCCGGLPVGIWSLIVLLMPEVRQAFAARAVERGPGAAAAAAPQSASPASGGSAGSESEK